MSFVRRIDPIEVEFCYWMAHFPESFHPYDRERFYAFVNAVLRYRKTKGVKWFQKDYFIKRCREYKTHFPEDLLESYWNYFRVISDYTSLHPLSHGIKYYAFDEHHSNYVLELVVDHKLKRINIDKETYDKKYLNNKEITRLLQSSEADKYVGMEE